MPDLKLSLPSAPLGDKSSEFMTELAALWPLETGLNEHVEKGCTPRRLPGGAVAAEGVEMKLQWSREEDASMSDNPSAPPLLLASAPAGAAAPEESR